MNTDERSRDGVSSVDEGGPFPIGAYLARQRVLRGLSLQDLEARTRIPRRSLQRLEAGVFDGESDGFARSFVRAVADALGLDPEDTTMLMLSEPKSEIASQVRYARIARRVLLGLVVLVILGALSGAVTRRYGAYSTGESDPPLVRVDAVRALAQSQRVRTGAAPEVENREAESRAGTSSQEP